MGSEWACGRAGMHMVGALSMGGMRGCLSAHSVMHRHRHCCPRSNIALMKRGAYIINCSRGKMVHQPDLLAALDSGHVRLPPCALRPAPCALR